MNNKQMTRDMVCKSHSARSEKELYRICPSKLNKRELEDLYFALIENNIDLKRTINSQKEKVKELSTKCQRMSAVQKSTFSKEQRECCLTIKAAYNEQKESIAELKRTNEKMTERIRLLNMRLCSAKQFLKRCPGQSTPQSAKGALGPIHTPKNVSTATLNINANDSIRKSKVASTQTEDKNEETLSVLKIIEKDIDDTRLEVNSLPCFSTNTPERNACNENKCKTVMEELNLKISNLQQELSNSHKEYGERIGKLEGEVSTLRADKTSVLSEYNEEIDRLTASLKESDDYNRELATQLSIQRQKVAEVETQLSSAQITARVADTVRQHVAKTNKSATKSPLVPSHTADSLFDRHQVHKGIENTSTVDTPESTRISYVGFKLDSNHEGHSKNLDDSGYADGTSKTNDYEDDNEGPHINRELIKKIEHLQAQFNDIPLLNLIDPANYTNDKNYSLPAALQQPPVQKPCVNGDMPRHSWDKAWAQYSTPSTSIGSTKDPKIRCFTGMYSASEQNEIDEGPSVADKDLNGTKSDEHNKYEIPGPLRIEEQNNGKPHRQRNFRSNPKEKTITDLNTIDEARAQDELTAKDNDNKAGTGQNLNNNNDIVIHNTVDENKLNPRVPSADSDYVNDNIHKMDSIEINRKRLTKDTSDKEIVSRLKMFKNGKSMIGGDSAIIENYSMSDYYAEHINPGTEPKVQREHGEKVKLSERIITPGLRPLLTNRGPVVSEEQSAGLLFAETGPYISEGGYNRLEPTYPANATQTDNIQDFISGTKEVGIQEPPRGVEQYAPYRKSPLYPNTRTYTVESNVREKCKGSDRDTDCEISELTDLPTEMDEKDPREYLSPGEEKTTSTISESRTEGTTDVLSSLSEGELPGLGTPRRLSEGEKPVEEINHIGQQETPAKKMETALQAITVELAKCKQLLLYQRRRQREAAKKLLDVEVMTDSFPIPIALKSVPGNERINETLASKCIFTLHIGTLVFSDQAVINSVDKSLILAWKFHDQSLTMTRMRTGRVVLFDFSTEYDVIITEEFLNYMKHEEMPIVICQIDKYEEPYATCSLPLRDALLHTNRRADMSLALCAGPQVRGALDPEQLDGDEELGVLDLWCMLRTDSRLIPVINKSIIGNSTSQQPRTSSDQKTNLVNSGSTELDHILRGGDLSNKNRLGEGQHRRHTNEQSVPHIGKQLSFDEQKPQNKGKRWSFKTLIVSREPRTVTSTGEDSTNCDNLTSNGKESNLGKKAVTIQRRDLVIESEKPVMDVINEDEENKDQTFDITILWLALNEESEVMTDPDIQRLYIAYSFLGRSGADLETPISLPKPKNYVDKCHFNFKKTFQLHESDLPLLGHMARCRRAHVQDHHPADCIVFTVISEPAEDPLGIARCEDIGEARVYLGDILSYSANSNSFMEVVPVWSARGATRNGTVLGVLAFKLDGLHEVRRCLHRNQSHRDLTKLH